MPRTALRALGSLLYLLSGRFREQTQKNKRRTGRARNIRFRGFRLGAGCFEQLERREVFNATYHGGALLPNVEVQAIYLGANWVAQPTLASEATQLDQYLDYLVHSPYMDMLTDAGYGVGQGTATAGYRANVSLSSLTSVTDADIRGVINQAIDLSLVQQPTIDRLYVVYVEPKNVNVNGFTSASGAFLGYHSAYVGADRQGVPFNIHYVVVPHPGAPNPTSTTNGYTGIAELETLMIGGTAGGSITPKFNNVAVTTPITRVDEVQRLEITGVAGDTVRLSFDGVEGTAATELNVIAGTSPTADEVRAHLASISALAGSGSVAVAGPDGGPFTITFSGTLTGSNVSPLTATVTGSTTAAVTTQTDGSSPTAAQVQASLVTIPALNGNVTVTAAVGGGFNISIRNLGNVQPIDVSATTGGLTGSVATVANGTSADFDQLTSVTSRFLANSVTDPNGGLRTRGWYDDQFSSEIADLGVSAAQIATVHSRLGPNQYYVQHVFNQTRTIIGPNTASDVLTTVPTITSIVQNSLSRATITWTPVAGATGYRVLLVNGTQTTLLARVPATQTSVQLTNLTPLTTLKLRVEAYNAAHVAASPDATYSVPLNPLQAPKLTRGSVTATSVVLNWTNNGGAAGFRIYQITGGKKRIIASADEAATSLTVKGLNPGSTVQFRVEAFYRGRNAVSNTITVKLPALVLSAPVVTVTHDAVNPAVVKLQWASIEAAQGYRIYRVQGTKRTLVKSLPATATSHTLAGFPSGSRFLVQAYRGTKTANSKTVTV